MSDVKDNKVVEEVISEMMDTLLQKQKSLYIEHKETRGAVQRKQRAVAACKGDVCLTQLRLQANNEALVVAVEKTVAVVSDLEAIAETIHATATILDEHYGGAFHAIQARRWLEEIDDE